MTGCPYGIPELPNDIMENNQISHLKCSVCTENREKLSLYGDIERQLQDKEG